MKKYIHVLNSEIVTKYESHKPKAFGGPWAEGVSIEVPEEMNLDFVVLDNKGKPKEREKKQEELKEEADEIERKELIELLKSIKKDDVDTVAKLKEVMVKLIKVVIK
jgi:hypothetical protein